MRTRARRFLTRFSYANIMSTLAVFLVLTGGAAYAANTVRSTDIVNNQVFSADVRDDTLPNGGLQGVDITDGSLTGDDLTSNTITGGKIADGTITSTDLGTDSVAFDELAFGTLPRFTYTATSSSATDTTVTKEVTATCSTRTDDETTGGGFVIAGPGGVNVPGVVVQRSYAVATNQWLVRAVSQSGAPNWQLTVVANCVG